MPALGTVPLQQLHHDHVRLFVADLVAAGRGRSRPVAGQRPSARSSPCCRARSAPPSSSTGCCTPVAKVTLPKVDKAERVPWSAGQAVTFLDHIADDRLGPLFEVLVSCGLRRGEALALRWCDIDIERRGLVVRRTLSDVGGHLVFSEPKTRASTADVGLPSRVVTALEVQEMRQSIRRHQYRQGPATSLSRCPPTTPTTQDHLTLPTP